MFGIGSLVVKCRPLLNGQVGAAVSTNLSGFFSSSITATTTRFVPFCSWRGGCGSCNTDKNATPWTLSKGGAGQWDLINVQTRAYHVGEGTVLWRRRREKGLRQRRKVLNPQSPVVDAMYPLPPDNKGKYPEEVLHPRPERDYVKEEQQAVEVTSEINKQIQGQDQGRLFAVILLKGKQFKVTAEDIIILQGYWAPDVGDRIQLHKVMLVGGKDFTLLGRPLIDDGVVRIEGTIIEKTLSYTKLHFILKKRKNFRRLKFIKDPYTFLRINMIELIQPLAMPQWEVHEDVETIDANFRVASKAE